MAVFNKNSIYQVSGFDNPCITGELVYETDWTTIPDVASSINDPYLTNQDAFIAYRNILRQLAVNPVTEPVFPTAPTSQWSS